MPRESAISRKISATPSTGSGFFSAQHTGLPKMHSGLLLISKRVWATKTFGHLDAAGYILKTS
ncbi:hypothetical protein HMPREF0580_2205 [Mobiluncus mulieris ATCC 35239]|uniref:Uncharacterized protein n=1 Tax=Mobiluncus mulieris ATCC 35239 TaxID=871571 RepID=E0QTJ0_9ACTO|nr:hypothetical protein HMPREF0580_2205 [Mobiluncus mulieris ATCC 35239]